MIWGIFVRLIVAILLPIILLVTISISAIATLLIGLWNVLKLLWTWIGFARK